ncbi:natural cytotoxicity triggering receptor 3 ligand 1-like [Eptesicus fuscus]|uniref:natural cytotoxicity triggering receptor 3 ligand 1-like n=1 Tax=Eptesicus fuscus TaxID=29078 RepID=UPI00240480B2|nr:natural cytotoxicity triggering receptor 3 ligand 1-like [Eptesicus fuscus]
MTVTGTAAAGRTFWGFLRPLPVLWFCVFPADFLIVEMEAKIQTVLLNDNVTISCKVPGSTPLNINIMGVIWYRKHQANEAEHKVFEMYGNYQQAFRPGASMSRAGLEKGDVSLHLPGVQLRDAGEYRCKVVVTPEQAQETVFLNVLASPECILFQEQAIVKDDGNKYILCKAHGFYPENIIIIWYTWTQENPQGQEISEGITTGPAIKNEDGTFNITSLLRLGHNVTTCQCMISHISLSTFCRLNFTQFQRGSEMGYAWETTAICIITGIYIVVAAAIIGWIRCFKKRKRLLRRHELPQEKPEELKLGAFTEVHS